MAKTSGEGFTFFKGNKRTKFFGEKTKQNKKHHDAFEGVYFLENKRENDKLNVVLVLVLFLESKIAW